MRRTSGLLLMVGAGVILALAAWWVLGTDDGAVTVDADPAPIERGASPLAVPKSKSKSKTIQLSRPMPASAPAPEAFEDEDTDEGDVALVQAEFDGRFELFQHDVQRAEACEILFDRHVEPFLRVEERLLSDALQAPEHLEQRLALLDTFEGRLVELLDKGNCP